MLADRRRAGLRGLLLLLLLLLCVSSGSQVAAADTPDDLAPEAAVDREADGSEPGSGPEASDSDEVELSESATLEAEARDSEGIEELTVTTRKREEAVQDIPASVSAFDSEALEELGFFDATELTKVVPNLYFTTTGGSTNTAQIFIRGIGQADGIINAEQGVGVYVNGVFQSRAVGSILGMGDLERVEVLRGPQGALYGKNAIGGSINFMTRKPSDVLEGSVQFAVGNYDTFNSLSVLNVPLGFGVLEGKILSRFVFATEHADGWQRDIDTGVPWSNNSNYMGRATLELLPVESLDLIFLYEQTRSHERNSRPQCKLVPERADSDWYGHIASAKADATLGGSFLEECERSQSGGRNGLLSNLSNENGLETKAANATIDWMSPDVPGLGPISVRGIGAWQRLDQDLNLELDGTGLLMLEARVRDVTQEQWSGDLQLSGVSFGDRLDWDLGLFYLQEDIEDPESQANAQTVVEQLADVFGAFIGPITIAQIDSQSKLKHKTYAGFLQGVITATDDLKFTLGARYVHENKTIDRSSHFEACQDFPGVLCVPYLLPWEPDDDDPANDGPPFFIPGPWTVSDGDEDFDAWTAVANVSYDFSDLMPDYVDHFMLFAGWSRGFRSGGFNYLAADSAAEIECDTPYDPDAPPGTTCQTQSTEAQTFDPEYLNAGEVGIKSDWFDRRLRFNLTYFYDYHEDIQQRQTIVTDQTGFGTTNAVLNTGNAIFQGGEIELEVLPIPELLFRFGVGLTFAKYDGDVWIDDAEASREASNLPDACPENDGVCIIQRNLKDEDLINTPPVTISSTVAYTKEVLDWGTLNLSMSWYMGGDTYFTVVNHDNLYQPRFHTFDARASFTIPRIGEIPYVSARFDLWVKNFTDQRFASTGIDLTNYHLIYNNPPRTYGGTITLMFGDH